MKKPHIQIASLVVDYAIGNLAQKALPLLLLPVLLSRLSPEDFGALALAGVTVTLLSTGLATPVVLGFGRFYYMPGREAEQPALVFNTILFTSVGSVLLAAVYWIAGPLVVALLFDTPEILGFVRLYAAVLLLSPISSLLLFILSLRERSRFYVGVSLGNLVLSGGLTLYLLVQHSLGIWAVAMGQVFGLAFLTGVCLPVVFKGTRPIVRLSVLSEPLRFGYAQIVYGYSSFLMSSGDRYVLRMFESVGRVGLYSVGYRLASAMDMLLVNPMKKGLRPAVYREEARPEEQRKMLVNAATYFYLIAVFGALGLSLTVETLLQFFARPELWASAAVVPILALAYAQDGLGYCYSWGLLMKNRPLQLSGIQLGGAVANIGLNLLMIPLWGLQGAAAATLLSYLIGNAFRARYAAKHYSLVFQHGRLLHITAVGLALFFVSQWIARPDARLVDLSLKAVLICSYPILLTITRFFSDGERASIQDLWDGIRKEGIRQTLARMKAA